MEITHQGSVKRAPWNKGKLVGQKAPLKQREIRAIRIRLQLAECTRELALFNLAVDSKLRPCDLVRLRVKDVTHGDQSPTGRLSCSRRLGVRCNLRSRNKLASPSQRGFGVQTGDRRITSFRVACALPLTCQRGNMRGSFAAGCARSA